MATAATRHTLPLRRVAHLALRWVLGLTLAATSLGKALDVPGFHAVLAAYWTACEAFHTSRRSCILWRVEIQPGTASDGAGLHDPVRRRGTAAGAAPAAIR